MSQGRGAQGARQAGAAEAKEKSTRQTWGVALMRTVTLVFVAAVVDWVGPFGFDGATDRQAAKVVWRIMAPFYGDDEKSGIAGPAGQSEIRVVLATDAVFGVLETNWPLDFEDHAHLLRRVHEFGPKAIFYDAFFLSDLGDEDGLDDFVAALDEIRRERAGSGGQPVTSTGPQGPLCNAGEILMGTVSDAVLHAQAGIDVEQARTVREKLDGVACLVALDNVPDAQIGSYPLVRSDSPYPSPALALYEAVTGDGRSHAGGRAETMAIYWGWELSPDQGQVHFSESAGCSNARDFFSIAFSELMQGLRDGGAEQRCPYHVTIPYRQLEATRTFVPDQAAIENGTLLPGTQHRGRETTTAELLRGKTVLVGFNFAGSGDRVVSPVHGVLPGVYAHAMALDNLLEYGRDGYYRYAIRMQTAGLTVVTLIELIMLAVFFNLVGAAAYLGRFALRPFKEQPSEPYETETDRTHQEKRKSLLLLCAGLFLLVGSFLTLLLSLEKDPRHWTTILLAMFALLWLLTLWSFYPWDRRSWSDSLPIHAGLGLIFLITILIRAIYDYIEVKMTPAALDMLTLSFGGLAGLFLVASRGNAEQKEWSRKVLVAIPVHLGVLTVFFGLSLAVALSLWLYRVAPVDFVGVFAYFTAAYGLSGRFRVNEVIFGKD